MEMKTISPENRKRVNEFIRSHWFSTDMAVRGELVDMTGLDGFVMVDKDTVVGLITYRIRCSECEILSLDSVKENQGIGTALLNAVVETAREKKCTRITLITTNDNMNAMRFYQKRGLDMVQIYRNALDAARELKPSIPQLGCCDIPLKHEIEFEMILSE